MNKFLFFLLAVILTSIACKKNESNRPTSTDKTYTVTFNTTQNSDGNQKLMGKALRKNSTASAAASTLYYIVTDTASLNPTVLRTISQDSASNNFGMIVDHLPAGHYMVYIVAGQQGLSLYSTAVQYATNSANIAWSDTFAARVPLTITNADVNQSVSLERIVAQLQVNINDALPSNAHSFAITVTNEYRYYDCHTQKPSGPAAQRFNNIIPVDRLGQANYNFGYIILNTYAPIKIRLICLSASGDTLADKTINNIKLVKNKRTVLSGSMFSNNNDVNVNFVKDWDDEIFKVINY
ncbi:hypothetical protein EOD41_14985 [Mucilaginibacter limnophilus]|uniref:FimB/Mfa2 family fimbrial subunit n=1 Tax=Mucilaginibacter limnophilus TaxID=1932778 RepID=A0A437MQ35_9SPHI|nr:FimB/Mfa2 family fimbrial subunit [Mucilaginibacter limnophilus]RVT99747.1 hypothetical protein EOD41_14985 [Mucilaginibacter limnophilus]